MSKEQIEEMAHVLCRITHPCEYFGLGGTCLAQNSAKILHNAGFRKIIQCKDCEYFDNNDDYCREIGIMCNRKDFCSFAKMKGGAE